MPLAARRPCWGDLWRYEARYFSLPTLREYSTNYELQYELRTRTTYYELRTRTTYYELRTTYVLRTTLYYDYSPGSNLRDAANSPVAHGGSSNSDGLASLSKGACEAKIPQ